MPSSNRFYTFPRQSATTLCHQLRFIAADSRHWAESVVVLECSSRHASPPRFTASLSFLFSIVASHPPRCSWAVTVAVSLSLSFSSWVLVFCRRYPSPNHPHSPVCPTVPKTQRQAPNRRPSPNCRRSTKRLAPARPVIQPSPLDAASCFDRRSTPGTTTSLLFALPSFLSAASAFARPEAPGASPIPFPASHFTQRPTPRTSSKPFA